MSANRAFEDWWEAAFHDDDWTGTPIYELVKTAWVAGYERHREETRTVAEHDDGPLQRVVDGWRGWRP